MTQTVGSRAASASLWMTPRWECRWYDRRKRCHKKGPGQIWEVGPEEPNKVRQGKVQGVTPGSEQSHTYVWTGRRNWEEPCTGGSVGSVGRWKAGKETAYA